MSYFDVHISTFLDQQVKKIDIIMPCSEMKWTPAALIESIQWCFAAFNEQLGNIEQTIVDSVMQQVEGTLILPVGEHIRGWRYLSSMIQQSRN